MASSTFTATSTWVAPGGVTTVTTLCWGGGKAGTAGTTNHASAGGTGGAFSQSTLAVTPTTIYTVTVGTGGASSAGSGGDSWFITSGTILAPGGGSATTQIGSIEFTGGAAGAGGLSPGGVNPGGGGGSSAGMSSNGNDGLSSLSGGNGGTAVSGGGAGGNGSGNGPIAGGNPGGGGGGGNGLGDPGGAGGNGQIILQWFGVDNGAVILQAKTTFTDIAIVNAQAIIPLTARTIFADSAIISVPGASTLTVKTAFTDAAIVKAQAVISLTARTIFVNSAIIGVPGVSALTARTTFANSAIIYVPGISTLTAKTTFINSAIFNAHGVLALTARTIFIDVAIVNAQAIIPLTARTIFMVSGMVTISVVAPLSVVTTLSASELIILVGSAVLTATTTFSATPTYTEGSPVELLASTIMSVGATVTAEAGSTLTSMVLFSARLDGIYYLVNMTGNFAILEVAKQVNFNFHVAGVESVTHVAAQCNFNSPVTGVLTPILYREEVGFNSLIKGMLSVGGCFRYTRHIFIRTQYGVGSVLYDCNIAARGILEACAITRIILRPPGTIYLDNNNEYHNEFDLCVQSQAAALVASYFQRLLAQVEYELSQCSSSNIHHLLKLKNKYNTRLNALNYLPVFPPPQPGIIINSLDGDCAAPPVIPLPLPVEIDLNASTTFLVRLIRLVHASAVLHAKTTLGASAANHIIIANLPGHANIFAVPFRIIHAASHLTVVNNLTASGVNGLIFLEASTLLLASGITTENASSVLTARTVFHATASGSGSMINASVALVVIDNMLVAASTIHPGSQNLTFASQTTQSAFGVTASVSAIDITEVFSFNSISDTTGMPKTMNVTVDSLLVLIVTFPGDYLGQDFSYTAVDGTIYEGTFTSGTVSF